MCLVGYIIVLHLHLLQSLNMPLYLYIHSFSSFNLFLILFSRFQVDLICTEKSPCSENFRLG